MRLIAILPGIKAAVTFVYSMFITFSPAVTLSDIFLQPSLSVSLAGDVHVNVPISWLFPCLKNKLFIALLFPL